MRPRVAPQALLPTPYEYPPDRQSLVTVPANLDSAERERLGETVRRRRVWAYITIVVGLGILAIGTITFGIWGMIEAPSAERAGAVLWA